MITLQTDEHGLELLTVRTPVCQAKVYLQGAHVTSWQPQGFEECLFLSPATELALGKAIRGGIPICWPWFGKKENSPAHGIARTALWSLHSQFVDTHGTAHITLSLYPKNDLLPALILRLAIGQSLSMTLETTARQHPYHLTEAFHNYFAVGNLTQCRISGLNHAKFVDCAQRPLKHGENPLAPVGALDRVYSLNNKKGTLQIHDPVLARTIVITRQNASSAVIWNPGQEGARSMPDLSFALWNQFICVETGNVSTEHIALASGQTHAMTQTIDMLHIK